MENENRAEPFPARGVCRLGIARCNHRVKAGAIYMHMPDADYFRHQAATCLRLAQFCRDLEVARRLFGMAEMDAGLQTMTVPSIAPGCGPARD
jgi:hypothetical protein